MLTCLPHWWGFWIPPAVRASRTRGAQPCHSVNETIDIVVLQCTMYLWLWHTGRKNIYKKTVDGVWSRHLEITRGQSWSCHAHTAAQSLITMMRTCRIGAWTLETFLTFIIQFYGLLTVGWLGAGGWGRRHIKLIRWPSCRQLKQSLNIIELLPSSHEKCFSRAARARE